MSAKDSFGIFLKDSYESGGSESVLSSVRKCVELSEREIEVLQAVEVGFGLKNLSANEIIDRLFEFGFPSARDIFLSILKYVENGEFASDSDTSALCFHLLDACLKIITYFREVLEVVKSGSEISCSQVESLVLASSELLYATFFHCENSQKFYGVHFTSLTSCLSELFTKSTQFQDDFSYFLTEKLIFEQGDEKTEGKILNDVLIFLFKSGFVLVNLDIKTMVKVWKTYAFLVDKYFSLVKKEHDIEETINCLCNDIASNVDIVFQTSVRDKNDFNKSIKLSCFYLKIVIKFCQIFNGDLIGCHKSLLHLLLTLSKCNVKEVIRDEIVGQDVLVQLTAGADPLLSQLISNKAFIKQCSLASKDLLFGNDRSIEFTFLCCMIVKKLLHCDKVTRSLWFNKNENIFGWVLRCASFGGFYQSSKLRLPTILVFGSQKKFNDFYEYVLVTMSAYLFTVTSDEFYIVENIMLKNFTNSNLSSALICIDLWCLLNRFSKSDLSWSHISKLSVLFKKLIGENLRMEKCFLSSLIFRLKYSLNECHKELFFQEFDSWFYFDLYESNGLNELYFYPDLKNSFDSYVSSNIIMTYLLDQDQSFSPENFLKDFLKNDCSSFVKLEANILKFWKFNCKILLSLPQSIRYLKKISRLSTRIIPKMCAENLLLVLHQLKKLLQADPQSAVKLFVSRILSCLSSIKIPHGFYQQNIVASIGEIFRLLLTSEEILVRQKTLECFYSFSHTTDHSEIIALSVYKSPCLKELISNYFKKKLFTLPDFNISEYICDLHQVKYFHDCQKNQDAVEYIESSKTNLFHMKDTISKLKSCGHEIAKNFETLTEAQKKELLEFFSFIFSIINQKPPNIKNVRMQFK